MANEKLNGTRHKYVSIDTAPGTDGEWSDPVSSVREETVKAKNIYFTRYGGGSATVTIQFKPAAFGSPWTDYLTDETLDDGARLLLDDPG